MKARQLAARVNVAFSLVFKDAAGNTIKTVPVRGSVPLEKPNGLDNRNSGQQSRT